MINIASVGNAIAIDVVVTRIDGAVGIGVDLAGVVLAIEITVSTRGLIDIASVGNTVAIDVVVAGVDGSIRVCIRLARIGNRIGIAVFGTGADVAEILSSSLWSEHATNEHSVVFFVCFFV